MGSNPTWAAPFHLKKEEFRTAVLPRPSNSLCAAGIGTLFIVCIPVVEPPCCRNSLSCPKGI